MRRPDVAASGDSMAACCEIVILLRKHASIVLEVRFSCSWEEL